MIEYEKDFVKNDVAAHINDINRVLFALSNACSSNDGWEMGEPEIIRNSDGKTVTIKVHLTKKIINNKTK